MVRTRIAPSPTGYFHIGTARTALFNYLFAKKNGGVFVLRIEDTDRKRSSKEYEDDIFDGLKWLGIDADEGPGTDDSFGPYRQSERMGIYQKHLRRLLEEGKAFQCYCPQTDDAESGPVNRLLYCNCYENTSNPNKNRPFIIRYKNEKFISDPLMKTIQSHAENQGGSRIFEAGGTTDSSDFIEFDDKIRGAISFLRKSLGNFSSPQAI